MVEVYQNDKFHAWFASVTDARGKMCLVSQGQGFSTISPRVSAGFRKTRIAGFTLFPKQIDKSCGFGGRTVASHRIVAGA